MATITRKDTAERLAAYLHHELDLDALVDWAENAMAEGDFEEQSLTDIRDVVARLGVGDVRSFGLTWEDCESMLKRLGYKAQVEITAAP